MGSAGLSLEVAVGMGEARALSPTASALLGVHQELPLI